MGSSQLTPNKPCRERKKGTLENKMRVFLGPFSAPSNQVSRQQVLSKPNKLQILDIWTQEDLDIRMQKLILKYPEVFSGIGKVKLKLIYKHITEVKRTLVAQRLRPVALHLMEPMRNHLEELIKGDVIEGPLGSE